ncbi:Gfo/Idh/MocA family oxidoreductase [candidate division KSB1 bacterium]|nr:Gfo/Idh/MocA family oxidoreductase [candidate division KSB1 bacterium]
MSPENQKTESSGNPPQSKTGLNRRDLLKALVSIPVLGGFFYSFLVKRASDSQKRTNILAELGIGEKAPAEITHPVSPKAGQLVRLGIIGNGGRGEDIIRSAGIATPEWVEEVRKNAAANKLDKQLEDWLNQDDLNVVLTGVCDVFDHRAEKGLAAAKNEVRPLTARAPLPGAKRYRHYQDLLASPDIDAVVIATPDHWHAPMVLEAVRAGKHVYCEKCMTRTETETHQLYDAVKNSNIVFQLGHQNRQLESHVKAKELIQKNILGKVTLIETTTNRNSPNGAWVYDIHETGSPKTIDWELFQAVAGHQVPFSLERFFRWRCWYDYGTGLAGDLLSHEYDSVNQIMELGIPKTAVATGGVYFFKDGRDVPDVFQAAFEYPERDLTLIYSATLASNSERGRIFMGHDASMKVGGDIEVYADWESTRYKDKIEKGIIDTGLPLFTYKQGAAGFDAVTSATEKYFATRGLLYTYREGKRVNTTWLHLKDWLDCIRNGGTPLCDIEQGYQEAITCHMATKSYLEGRKVTWDAGNRKIV